MTAPAPAPSEIFLLFDKNFTTAVNFVQNVVYVFLLFHFLGLGITVAKTVSPVDSWMALFFNMWVCTLMFAILLAFKDTLECLILFENAKRRQESRKDATTTFLVTKNGAQINHVDYGSNTPAWPAVAGLMVHKFMNKEDENNKDASAQNNEEEAKEATTPSSTIAEDEIKQDAASASSSARSSADTSDVLN
jgi:hypothetical protein